MTRPRIWKDTTRKVRPWCATHPDNPSLWRLCETWREAMEFVGDTPKRPLVAALWDVGEEPITSIYEDGDVVITDENDGDQIILPPRHWRPLARALTRLADKENIK